MAEGTGRTDGMCTCALNKPLRVWIPDALNETWKEVQFVASFEVHETEPDRAPDPSMNNFDCLVWMAFDQLVGYLMIRLILPAQTVLKFWREHAEQSHKLGVVRHATDRQLSHGCEQRETNKSKC